MEDEVKVPKSVFDWMFGAVKGIFEKKNEPVPEPETPPEPAPVVEFKVEETDQFKAVQAELATLKAEKATAEAEQAQKARVDAYAAKLAEVKVAEGSDVLASMTDAQADWVVSQFKTLRAQVDESALLTERGSSGPGPDADPKSALNAAVVAYQAENKCDYPTAFTALQRSKPELFK